MKLLKLSHILKAAFWSLLLFAIGFSLFISIKESEFNLMGLVISIYYLIPIILFALSYVALLSWLIDKFEFLSSSLISQIILSVTLGLLYMTFWIIYDGASHDYRDMNFFSYWIRELKRYWLPLIYFGITIPVILNIIIRKTKPDGKQA